MTYVFPFTLCAKIFWFDQNIFLVCNLSKVISLENLVFLVHLASCQLNFLQFQNCLLLSYVHLNFDKHNENILPPYYRHLLHITVQSRAKQHKIKTLSKFECLQHLATQRQVLNIVTRCHRAVIICKYIIQKELIFIFFCKISSMLKSKPIIFVFCFILLDAKGFLW